MRSPPKVTPRRPPADPVHLRHHRLSEGRDAHPRQHAAQRLGGRPAPGHPVRRPLLQLPAVLPRRRHDAVAPGLAHRRRLPGHAADLRGRRRAAHDGARALHAHLGQRHAVPAHDGPPELRPGATAPARRLGGGRAGDHPQHHREDGRARRLRGLRPVGSLAQRRAQRLSRSGRAAHRRARQAARRRRGAHHRIARPARLPPAARPARSRCAAGT